jgi:DNA-binding NtrC family response regulator
MVGWVLGNPSLRARNQQWLAAMNPAIRGATILLVDDDPAVCESLRRVLATEGWRIVTASGGEDALEYLQGHEPDLMITDLCMEKVNGWDLLFHETLQRPRLPIFVVTALSLKATGDAALVATEFFQKPVDIEVLVGAARRHLAEPGLRRLRPGAGRTGRVPATRGPWRRVVVD